MQETKGATIRDPQACNGREPPPRVWSIDEIVGLLDRRTERAAEQQEERDGSYVTSSRRPWTGSSIRSVDKNFGGSRSRHELFHLGVGRPFLHKSHGTQDETGKVGVGRIVRLDNRRLPAVAGVGFKLKHYPEIRDIEHEVLAVDRVRRNHVFTCSEELLVPPAFSRSCRPYAFREDEPVRARARWSGKASFEGVNRPQSVRGPLACHSKPWE